MIAEADSHAMRWVGWAVGAASDFWGDAKVPARKEAGQAAATGKATGDGADGEVKEEVRVS